MHDETNPWSHLSIPDKPNSYSSRRVATPTSHSFYWAKNDLGQCCLIFSCASDTKVKIDEVKLKGILLEQHISNEKQFNLIIKLIDDPSRDIFRTICNDLVASTRTIDAKKPSTVVLAINARLKRWQELLGKKKSDLLSNSEQLGLFGELSILNEYFLENFKPITAIATWRGPSGSEQDFGFGEHLVEVKSQFSTSDSKIQINSLEQLDDISGYIWLVHQTFAANEHKSGISRTLNAIVSEISSKIDSDIFAMDSFKTILLEIGFEADPAYDEVAYELAQRTFFKVSDAFPRIKRSSTPSEIISARYVVDIGLASHLSISENQFLGEVFRNEQA
ncbi:PD-(D/E)XK motif protein [Candidatus Puniceispirillum marinum]|uniref:PD-(D/E)XK motif protein n=1 Tax=Puniceispirillum marinum (strain IMCC1322) TaxID=488538 RepID=D5BTE4_PUNMI|nr:PD-(D/E)XK motif protein [Candidatus Puniceispirillum marinum]ADE39541.1 hypothetical protein SAR116_1298 [Candidatus Puniceispirillum marinum IMCC1322]